MKYGSCKYGDGTHWGETVSPFTEDTSTSVSFSTPIIGADYNGYFGGRYFIKGYFEDGYFGIGKSSLVTVTFSKENPTTVVFS